jgi:hypothetical protein
MPFTKKQNAFFHAASDRGQPGMKGLAKESEHLMSKGEARQPVKMFSGGDLSFRNPGSMPRSDKSSGPFHHGHHGHPGESMSDDEDGEGMAHGGTCYACGGPVGEHGMAYGGEAGEYGAHGEEGSMEEESSPMFDGVSHFAGGGILGGIGDILGGGGSSEGEDEKNKADAATEMAAAPSGAQHYFEKMGGPSPYAFGGGVDGDDYGEGEMEDEGETEGETGQYEDTEHRRRAAFTDAIGRR